jgi:hypothetical protein
MVGFRKSLFSCLVLACSVTSAGARDADSASRAKAKAIHAQIQRQPMIFFVAKGGVDACGPGCSEWIAAEGPIDDDAGQRFRDFLKRLPRADLPVFFNSAGGVMAQAMVLGTLVRERRMTVGIGRTLPEGCRTSATIDAACRRVIQSKSEHRARLVTEGARCFSACVQAFTGGSVRLIARDAQLGIHAGRQFAVVPQGSVPGVVDVQAVVRRYTVEMGVDPVLVDATAEISADRIRILSRAEIARFAVETRGSHETRWLTHQAFERMTGQGFSNQFSILKSITEATGADSKEYRTSGLRISCIAGGAAIWLVYEREPSPKEMGSPGAVRVAAGANEYVLERSEVPGSLLQSVPENHRMIGRLVVEIGQAKAGSEQQNVAITWEFLRSAAAASSIVITESFAPQGSGSAASRVVKFSTDGLSKAVGHLQKNCGQAKVL